MRVILITSGDKEGVGLEISLKALRKLGPPPKGFLYVLYYSKSGSWPKNPKDYLRSFNLITAEDDIPLTTAISLASASNHNLLLISSRQPEALWVKEVATYCLQNPKLALLVTGPLSKQKFSVAGLKALGHTGLLRSLSKEKELLMSFIGQKFSVVLLTDHIPIRQVARSISLRRLNRAKELVESLQRALPELKRSPLITLGINPHAGDGGLIGTEELALSDWDFISADSAFTKALLKQRPIYLATNHDQGLIPFKMAHDFDSGVHLTLGLPFFRCSVDHGPAIDIFKKGVANEGSMLSCLKLALKIKETNFQNIRSPSNRSRG